MEVVSKLRNGTNRDPKKESNKTCNHIGSRKSCDDTREVLEQGRAQNVSVSSPRTADLLQKCVDQVVVLQLKLFWRLSAFDDIPVKREPETR